MAGQAGIDRCVRWISERIDAIGRPPRSLAEAPDSRLQVVLQRAGYKRRTESAIDNLGAALTTAGIKTYPELSDPTLAGSERIYFFRQPIAGLNRRGALFGTERELEEFLVSNFSRLEPLRGLRLRSRQYRFPDSLRTIDLLCEDRSSRELVGIELKHGVADRGLPAQMIDYMIELELLAKKEKRPGFRGIVLTGQPDSRLADLLAGAAASRGYRVSWLIYQVDLALAAMA